MVKGRKTKPKITGERVRRIALPLLFAFLAFAILLPLAPHLQPAPLTDSSIFLYMGDRILEGAIPYRDVWDHKGPLIYYLNAIGLGIAGGSRWGVWFLEWVFVFAAAWIGYRLIERVFGLWPAVFASLLFLLQLILVLDRGNLTEEYALPFQFLTLSLFRRAVTSKNLSAYFPVGLVAAFSFLLRPNIIAIPLAISGYLIWAFRENRKKMLKALGYMVAGGFVVLGAVSVYFLSVRAFPALWDAVFDFNFAYNREGLGHRWESVFSGIKLLPIISLFGLSGGIFAVGAVSTKLKISPQIKALLIVLSFALPLELLLTAISGRNFPHYYMSWLPTLTLLSAFFLYFLSLNFVPSRASFGRNSLVRLVALALLLGFALVPTLELVPALASSLRSGWQTGGLPPVDLSSHRYKPVLDYISTNTSPDQSLLMWGNSVVINWLADRDAPTPFVYQTPLIVEGYATREMALNVIAELEANPPVIIDTGPPGGFLLPIGVRLDRVPAAVRPLYRYLQEHYVYSGTFSSTEWDLYLYHGEGVSLSADGQ